MKEPYHCTIVAIPTFIGLTCFNTIYSEYKMEKCGGAAKGTRTSDLTYVEPLDHTFGCVPFGHSTCTHSLYTKWDEERRHNSFSLFNPELKFLIGISSSYKLQIWCFIFPNFYKIMIFHLIAFFVCYYAPIRIYTYDLFSSIQIETIKIYFCITISLVTTYFIILWYK